MLFVFDGSSLAVVADRRSLHLRLRDTPTVFSLSSRNNNVIMSDFEEFEKQLSENRQGENSHELVR